VRPSATPALLFVAGAIAAASGAAAPPAPTERVLDATTVATRTPVTALAADGARVAFAPRSARGDCAHVAVWTPAAGTLDRWGTPTPCLGKPYGRDGIAGVALAGQRAAWVELDVNRDCTSSCTSGVATAVLGESASLRLNQDPGDPGAARREYNLRGHGDLLVFNEVRNWLTRIGAGSERCPLFDPGSYLQPPRICTTLRRGAHACCAASVAGGLIAVVERAAVAVVNARGKVVRSFRFAAAQARLDGAGRLMVARGSALQAYDVASGARQATRPMPSGYRLADADGGIAVLRGKDTSIRLVRLADGRSFTLQPGKAPRLSDLEPTGLYYAYATAGGEGRIVFMPRAEVERRLQTASRLG
jgi:hypothetical protein